MYSKGSIWHRIIYQDELLDTRESLSDKSFIIQGTRQPTYTYNPRTDGQTDRREENRTKDTNIYICISVVVRREHHTTEIEINPP